MNDLLLPYATSSLFLSSLPSTNSPLSLPLLSLSLLLLLALEYFTYYLNYTFAMHYTHAEVPGSSDTSGDSGGRRPRRRSEIQCNITIRKKAFYRITFLLQWNSMHCNKTLTSELTASHSSMCKKKINEPSFKCKTPYTCFLSFYSSQVISTSYYSSVSKHGSHKLGIKF